MTIEEIKQKLSINEVLAYYGLKPKNGMINCPFHADKTPSMQVFLDSNSVRCYSGNCAQSNKVIDVIDFIMYKENLSKGEAIIKANQLVGGLTGVGNQTQCSTSVSFLPHTKEYQELPMERLETLFSKMKNNLKQSKAAREYTESRALEYEKIEIGYNGRTYKGIINCLVFPLKDKEGKIVSLYGRSIKAKGHYYLKNRQGLYPGYPNKNTQKLILTESIIDAASLLQNKEITENYSLLACYGVNGFTEEHKAAIEELKELEEIILMFDNDEAGEKGAEKLAEELMQINPNLQITKVALPNKDINETLQLHEKEIFGELLVQRHKIEDKIDVRSKNVRSKEEAISDKEKSLPLTTYTLGQINDLIGQSGIIGEENTRLLLFIIASSYKTHSPLHGIVQGSSGSGKTHLISKIADLLPPEDVLRFTRITESSLYNWGEWDLVGKHIVIEDLDGLKEEALYSLRELISSQKLSSSVSIKDKQGNIKSTQKKVRGQFSSLSATTKGDIYEDNISRSFILAVDESTKQSKKIIDYQNKKYAGEVSREEEKQAKDLLQEYIRNLQPVEVINPYATKLELPQEVHKIRRLNEMYQSIIRQITYLNQKQRRFKNGRIYTEIEDLEQATEILFESILLKIDELDGSLRQFYERLKKYIKTKEKEFYLREVRQNLNISKTQMFRYIQSLKELDYIRPIGGYTNTGVKYKILYWDDYQKLRQEIKIQLQAQIERLKQERTEKTKP